MYYVYNLQPIDLGWEYLTSFEQAKKQSNEPENIISEKNKAEELAKLVGWEGEYSIEPHLFFIPAEVSMTYGFIFKQENNGQTFVISSVKFPHLKKFTHKYLEISEA